MSGLVLLPLLLLSTMCRESLTADPVVVDATQHKLPKSVTPRSYALHLEPDLEKFMFNGIVNIIITANNATNVVTLNAKNLTIDSAAVKEDKTNTVINVTNIAKGEEMVTLTLNSSLTKNLNYILTIPFSGTLNDEKRGFYRSRYLMENGTVKYIATTHFEPTGARRAFPCWDEPEYKATFDITITHLKKYTAISNMPEDTKKSTEKDNKKTTVFTSSPPMSTYLVAFVVSDYSYTQKNEYRVWTKPHAVNQTQYALNLGEKVINELNHYTNILYTDKMRKMDQITIKDFTAGAMENWGLVTYRETALLYDANTTTTSSQLSIATIIAHEFAHQWFGNLVSPKWWKYIWLNEGFATYFQYYIIDKLEPDWRVMEVFVTNGLQARALATDAGEKSRPMNQDAQSPNEISALFDRIAYEKAGSVIRMMSLILTPGTFQKGLQSYLQKYNYSNAESHDLLSTLDEVANAKWEGQNFTTIMEGWVDQAGSPVVYVNNTGDNVEITQKRFTLDNTNNGNTSAKWWVPITLVTSSKLDFTNATIVAWLNPQDDKAKTISKKKDDWVIVNVNQTGYYRVNYDNENWENIIKFLASKDFKNISPLNRAQLIDDAFNLAQANQLNYTVPLSLAMYLTKEVDYIPWNSAFRSLNFLDNKLQNTESYTLFQEYIRYFMKGLSSQVKYVSNSTDNHVTKMLRTSMMKYACKAKEPDCTNSAQTAFNAWIKDSTMNPLHPDLKNSIICAGLRSADEATWNKTKDLLMATYDQDEKDSLFPLMGCSGKEAILEKLLRSSLAEDSEIDFNVAVQAVVYDHVKGVDIALKVIGEEQENINKLEKKSWVETIGSAITTEKQLTELTLLVPKVGVQAESFLSTVQTVTKNIQWRNSHSKNIAHWLTDNKNRISSATTITFTSLLMIVSIVITRFY